MSAFSLPTQRCFWRCSRLLRRRSLFSAYAEVFLEDCGTKGFKPFFSLPTQRCFSLCLSYPTAHALFSAYAEVFLKDCGTKGFKPSFLCLRRGVSLGGLYIRVHQNFSLPTQRCFFLAEISEIRVMLFSAYAEVFLYGGMLLCG